MRKFLTLLFFSLSTIISYAQCNFGAIESSAVNKIGKYIEIKSYNFDVHQLGSTKEIEYSYVLGKDKEYVFSINNENTANPKIIITLYNNNKKAIASNYNEKTGTYNSTFFYKCPATKLYYITFTVKDESTCATCVIGFKASSSEKIKAQNW
ncbi:MAG: hypothetical protein RL711_704 [Bacteroidota bacterium]